MTSETSSFVAERNVRGVEHYITTTRGEDTIMYAIKTQFIYFDRAINHNITNSLNVFCNYKKNKQGLVPCLVGCRSSEIIKNK